jgi:DNA-binding HxlR family transcriptional regulator
MTDGTVSPQADAAMTLDAYCPHYTRAVEVIGRRWSGAILRALLTGASRFSQIQATIPGLSQRLLSERLRELEREGLLTREVYPEIPVRIEYRLTPQGAELRPVIEALTAWVQRWIAPCPDEAGPDAGGET